MRYGKKMTFLFWLVAVVNMFIIPVLTSAQEMVPDTITTMKAEVLRIEKQEEKNIPGTDTPTTYQTLTAKIQDGAEKGAIITIENDTLNLKEGEIFFLTHTTNHLDGTDFYTATDPYRLSAIYFFVGLFVLLVFIFGGKQGIRGLVVLVLSIVVILYLLVPGILHGYSPLLLSMLICSFIVIVGSYITHGVSKTTTVAVIGMITTILITGILAYVAVYFTRLSGYSSEEAVYLNFNTQGIVNFSGLLLGGIMIGLLGVLYDAAIGQAVAIEELHSAGKHLSRKMIYTKAKRIGREHIGALVNTLAIAYVGASLPLLLLYATSTANISIILNQEIFATEIIRIMIGSIGLVLAVPITTAIGVLMLVKKKET